MAIRIRKGRKIIVCAAEHPVEEGDIYLDDAVHHCLSTELGVLRTDDEGDSWYFLSPERVPRTEIKTIRLQADPLPFVIVSQEFFEKVVITIAEIAAAETDGRLLDVDDWRKVLLTETGQVGADSKVRELIMKLINEAIGTAREDKGKTDGQRP